MPETRWVAVALMVDQPYPINQETYAGVLRFAEEHPHWRIVVDEQPWEHSGTEPAHFDGVIARGYGKSHFKLEQIGIPMVNTRFAHDRPTTSGVFIDAQQCGELAADHLIDRGFQRLAFLVDPDFLQAVAVCKAFVQQAEERGRTCTPGYIDRGTKNLSGYWLAAKNGIRPLLARLKAPVGVLCANAWMARLTVTLADELGWHVPQDVAIISMENLTTILEHRPQITSIDMSYEQIGYEAAAMLDRMMDGTQTQPQQIYVPPEQIITRASTDYFAVEDEVVAATLRYISEHLDQKLTLDRLAELVIVSPRSLQRRFESALNRPISDEIRRLRLEAAKRLLRDHEMQVGQIARQVGFNTSVTIYNVFQRELGMSPSEYRQKYS
ncbi:MAG: helix-turn-helix domain-containing protein [Phycisphaera sp.]|nr:helix-turn-helix domain-containing protein [Phycisphaera sp.]